MARTVPLDKHKVVIDCDEYERLKKLSKTRNVFIEVQGGVASVDWDKTDGLVRVSVKDYDV